MFAGMRRGSGGGALAAHEQFPSAEWLASREDLGFSVPNAAGKVILGTIGSPMNSRRCAGMGGVEHFTTGGDLCGIADNRHHLLVAGSRAGKGRSHLVPLLQTYPGSVWCIDIKGDLAGLTAKYRAEVLGQRVFVLDPFDAAPPAVAPYREGSRFDPLSGVDPADADAVLDRADLAASALVVRGRDHDPHWNDVSQQAVQGVCAHTLTSPLYAGRRTLATVAWLLWTKASRPDADTPSDLEAEMRTNLGADGAVQAAAAELFDKADRELSGCLSTIRRHLHWLGFPRMQRVVTDGTLDLSTIQTQPTTVYLSLPVRKLSSCAGWLRLMLNSLLATAEAGETRRLHQVGAGGYPTLVLIDEMSALGGMRELEVAAGLVAGLGLKLYFVLQDLSQLKALYPASWETFLGNCGTITAFGNVDSTTLEWLEKRLGNTTIVQQSMSDGSYRSLVHEGTSGRSGSMHTHPLMTAAEIARVFNRDDELARQLVISARHGPMILQRVNYDTHPVFASLLKAEKG